MTKLGVRRCVLVGGLLLVSAWSAGCAEPRDISPRPGPLTDVPPAEADARAAEVRADPVAYLRTVLERTRALDQYALEFTRYERRGLLLPKLEGPENIVGWFRRAPFSVRLKWLNEDLKYDESSYVAGAHGNKVRFTTRWWVPGLRPPPGINEIDLQTPVTWGETKRPLTDFGLERLMERTLKSLHDSGNDAVVEYVGLARTETSARTVHHIRLTYSPAKYPVPVQELYVDVQTDLPAGTELKLPNGVVDAAYFYDKVDPTVRLTDADFLLTVERTEPAAEKR